MNHHFTKAKGTIKDVCNKQGIKMPQGLTPNLLNFLSDGYRHEEEGEKLCPELLLTTDFAKICKTLTNYKKFNLRKGQRSGKDLKSCLKPIIPFCQNGWVIYADIHEKHIEYGIVRSFSGIQGVDFTENVFSFQEYPEAGLVHFKYANQTDLVIRSLSETKPTTLSLSFTPAKLSSSPLERFVNLATAQIDSERINEIKKSFTRFYKHCFGYIHGTIIVVVKDNYEPLKQGYLSDGIWLDTPIDLAYAAETAIISDATSPEEFYGLCGLLIQMVNFDGITIIDQKGRVIAYNCFVHEAQNSKKKNSGGARKRAYTSLCSHSSSAIAGTFFQSHDGNTDLKLN